MTKKIKCTVVKAFNNNVILVKRKDNKKEEVLVGKGIAFGKKEGAAIKLDPEKIEKSFVTYGEKFEKEYFSLIDEMDGEIIRVCEEIISIAEENLGQLNQHIHIALTDHVSFARERMESDMVIEFPFLEEIKILYKDEYKVAVKALEILNNKLDTKLPEDEIGFITMHFYAARENTNVRNTYRNVSLINELIDIIQDELNIELDPGDSNYIRLVNHLHFSIERVNNNIDVQNPLIESIKSEFNQAYSVSDKLSEKIKSELDLEISEAEKGYMTIHLQRLNDVNSL
ncbi:BglG family transcriptional antiterminator [Halanaerobium saccharolyticum]|uniref:BglG family transcriptional antiterminator n=1 Tax=Halanaerobium saccharolyticum TaxID=43595 RepID=A0A4R7YZM8_9FIRM|nr:PRD domain-containing protein [Halanaerobium saccharolyticum]RAK06322.1 BglG family transcriptional antiterminator [Halanaerobium saccharolyticum]TDW00634.1 BglG family transcriptional antiterminator [Halanaerobium saccharolyticum]TDX52247.1 BglG family transcriptional antiterminator [Halanaerobium saccharolyticum]